MSLIPVGGGAIVQKDEPPVGPEGEVWYKPADLGEKFITGFDINSKLGNLNLEAIVPTHTGGAYLTDDGEDIHYLDITTGTLTDINNSSYVGEHAEAVESKNYLAFFEQDILIYDKNSNAGGNVGSVGTGDLYDVGMSDTYVVYSNYSDEYKIYNFQTNSQVSSTVEDFWSGVVAINDSGNYVYLSSGVTILKCNVSDLSVVDSTDMNDDVGYMVADSDSLYAVDQSGNLKCYDYSSLNLQWTYNSADSYSPLRISDKYITDGSSTLDKNTGDVITEDNKCGPNYSIHNGALYSEINGLYTITPVGPESHISEVFVSNGNEWMIDPARY
jgi:hypothetical protein